MAKKRIKKTVEKKVPHFQKGFSEDHGRRVIKILVDTFLNPHGIVYSKIPGGGVNCVFRNTPAELEEAHRLAMERALEALHQFKDIEPLLYQCDRRNPYFNDYPEACLALGKYMRGEPHLGRGKPFAVENIDRNARICQAVFLLKTKLGLPVKAESKRPGHESACLLVADRIKIRRKKKGRKTMSPKAIDPMSPEAIYTIWKKHGYPHSPDYAYLSPWEYLDIAPPSVEEILDYCLDGTPLSEEREREIVEAIERYLRQRDDKKGY